MNRFSPTSIKRNMQFCLSLLFFIGAFFPIVHGQTDASNEYLTMVVEFHSDRQFIYIAAPNEPAKQIVILPNLKDPNNITRNVRLRELDEYKSLGYQVRKTRLSGLFDHTLAYEYIKTFESQGWKLLDQDFSLAGAANNDEFNMTRATHYSFIKTAN